MDPRQENKMVTDGASKVILVSQNYHFLSMHFFHSTEVQNADILHHSSATDKINQIGEYLYMLSSSML